MDIKLNNVSKLFNPGKTNEYIAINNISLEIKKGEFVSIMGDSGSGKTTLLNLIGGLDLPNNGDIYIGNQKINDMSDFKLAKFRNENIGFVFQDYALIPYKTVEENMELPLYFSDISSKEHKKRISEQLENVNMSAYKKSKVFHLSGGEKQRVAIARSLVTDPQIVLADEPTGALDSNNSQEIIALLKRINDMGKTVVVVTHDIKVAEKCNRIIRLSDGTLDEKN